MSRPPRRFRPAGYLLAVLGLAAAYFLTGRLSLLLAVPPGFASPVWPPAGIALACVMRLGARAWPGVWLGSFAVNYPLIATDGLLATSAVFGPPAWAAGGIASGAALQAVCGAALVQRFVGAKRAFESNGGIAGFLLLAGPVACLVAPIIGTTTLRSAGVLSAERWLHNWVNWWVGDTIGTVLFASIPLFMLTTGRHAPLHRKLLLVGPIVLTFAGGVALFLSTSRLEAERVRVEFERRSEEHGYALRGRLEGILEALHGMERLFSVYPAARRGSFRIFVAGIVDRHPGLRALDWAPRVKHVERRDFETAVRSEGLTEFRINELSGPEGQCDAAAREEYFPVTYVEPLAENHSILGFDLGSEVRRRETLELARDLGLPRATAPLELVAHPADDSDFLIALPVYSGRVVPPTVEERRASLLGFAVGACSVPELFDPIAPAGGSRDLALVVRDAGDAGAGTKIHSQGVPSRASTGLSKQTVLEVFGRRWSVEYLPGARGAAWNPSLWEWLAQAGGLLFTTLLVGLGLILSNQARMVQEQVAHATRRLRRANEQLRWEVEARERTQQDLQRSNRELEDFAYVAAHDLQEPLRMVSSYIQLLSRRHGESFDEQAWGFVEHAVEGAKRMSLLLDDLLHLSRVGTQGSPMVMTSAREVLEDALADLTQALEESRGVVEAGTLPVLWADPVQLRQVFQNLVGNALKFRRPDEAPRVRIDAERHADDGAWVFHVRDNGIGFEPRFAERIFTVFKRLHNRARYPGNGAGLTICKKIVERHGGRIWAESEPGRGACFHFTWPAAPPAAKSLVDGDATTPRALP